jgi:hypothetical protein
MSMKGNEMSKLCGHVNKHSLGLDSLPDNMTCFLPPGHEGPHRGKHKTRFVTYKFKDRKVVEKNEEIRDAESEWLDEANVPVDFDKPVREIKPKSLAEQEFGEHAKEILGG